MTPRAAHILLAAVTISAGASCADVPAAFGPTPTAARANADALFGGMAGRFTNVTRTPRYARARELLGRYALMPSRIYDDTTLWTVMSPDGTRTLFGQARITDGRYVFSNAPTDAPLDRSGDGRHIMRVRRVAPDVYEWFTGVDFAAGTITAADAQRVVNAWLAGAEGRTPAQIRAGYAQAFPRTTAALGRLFSLDTLITVRDAQGGNTVYLGIKVHPDGIRAQLPEYAAFLDRYPMRAQLRFALLDSHGAEWAEIAAEHGYITVRVRSRDGHFAPLQGPVRPIPDTLTVRMDMTARVKIFTVGVTHLVGQWVNVADAHERGWAMRFTREPNWVLPPLVGTLIRSPLRRPFLGEGTQFRIVLHDDPGHQTLLSRRGLTAVQESAVMRFLGKLSGTAMGDYVTKAEEQENRFDASVFEALKGDVDAVLR